ncbi:MAG: DUF6785 family protein [Phycisphaeraceae bacterium]
MTIRAVIVGLLLGLFVSVATYYNDVIIAQSLLILNLFPRAVMGIMLLLVLGLNPLLGLVGRRWMLGRGELAVIVALGMAASAWPDSAFYRSAVTNMAMPGHLHKTTATWRASELMSYVPGGSARLAAGHVRDWSALAGRIIAAGRAAPESPGGQIWHRFSAGAQHDFRQAADRGRSDASMAERLGSHLNRAMTTGPLLDAGVELDRAWPQRAAGLLDASRERHLAEHEVLELNRWLLVGQFGELVLPPPRGRGVLLLGGRDDPVVVGTLLTGRPEAERWSLDELPWAPWWPTIRLWGGAALLIGVATFCMALIVHPQWSRKELLAYPIARFVTEATAREPDAWLPKVARSPVFWWAFGSLAVIHLANGLSIWMGGEQLLSFALDFSPLREIFPTASRVTSSRAYFEPIIYLTAVGLAFFLPTTVSFSLGIAPMLFILLAATMLRYGVPMDSQFFGSGKPTMLRFGAYVGVVAVIAYTGRHYYATVLTSATGLRRNEQPPGYVIWAARGLAAAGFGAIALLYSGGLSWTMSTVVVVMILATHLVMTRVVAETGLIFIQTYWMPAAVITALVGFDAVGPTAFIVLALASTMLLGDPRTALMPNLANALQVVERSGQRSAAPRRAAPWILLMIVAGFVVAGIVTFQLQYNHDVIRAGVFTRERLPSFPFHELDRLVRESAAVGTLSAATASQGLERLAAIRFDPRTWGWTLIGLGLFATTAAARLRLPWWPLHPVAFVVWGTLAMDRFAVSFLLGCLIKAAVVKVGGARGFELLMPCAVGVIAGQFVCQSLWMIVGAIYYFTTGQQPISYAIF